MAKRSFSTGSRLSEDSSVVHALQYVTGDEAWSVVSFVGLLHAKLAPDMLSKLSDPGTSSPRGCC